jgi:mannan endo-1,4-beta-mannosidase
LQRLDFVITEARKRGLNLTLVLTNNWQDFGGMDQYLVWYGLRQHHEFYTDERTKHAYQNYVRHIVERVNSIDGVPYKDDPTIFAWELANEPRTVNGTNFDSQQGWSEATISSWAQEMSTFIKSLDPNHMVAVGDEGFFSNESLDHWAYQAPYGVDGSRLTSLPDVDFGTYHLYPSHWGVDHSWGNDWIAQHIALSRRLDKPLVLEEYGMPVTREQRDSNFVISGWQERKRAYADWNELVLLGGGQAAMFWLLSGMEQRPQPYPDYDHFGVYRGDRTSSLLKGYATRMTTEATACRLANGELRRDPSPFVRAHRAPQIDKSASASPGRTSSPLGTEPSPGR